jgi:putative DNA primase/helicase
MSSNRPPIDFNEVKSAALADIRGVLGRFLPGGKIIHGEYVALNPTRRDRNLGSFRVNLKSGQWADFATGDRGRDLISLIAYLKRISQYDAAKGLSEMLGVGRRR